jgi:hypothetical protein
MACIIFGVELPRYTEEEFVEKIAPLMHPQYKEQLEEDAEEFLDDRSIPLSLKNGSLLWQVNNIESSKTYIVLKRKCLEPDQESTVIIRPNNAEVAEFNDWLKQNDIIANYKEHLVLMFR